MDLNKHGKKIIAGGIGAGLLIVILGTNLVTASLMSSPPIERPDPLQPPIPAASRERTPAEALSNCDSLAAAPGDTRRTAAPVPDEQFAPGAAVEACREAVAKNQEEARAHFQLGRAYWLAHQDAQAFAEFKIAYNQQYPAASLYLGHAYRDGRLPPGDVPNIRTAISLYESALSGGVEGAAAALDDARRQLDRMVFDKNLFQNGDFMERIYNGDYGGMKFPVSLVFYMQGIAAGLEDSQVVFIDQTCKSLVSKAGLDIIRNADGPVAWAQILSSAGADGKWSPEGLINALGSSMVKDYLVDQGVRDATILYNDDGRYGCKSDVTKQVLSNMMLVIRNNSS